MRFFFRHDTKYDPDKYKDEERFLKQNTETLFENLNIKELQFKLSDLTENFGHTSFRKPRIFFILSTIERSLGTLSYLDKKEIYQQNGIQALKDLIVNELGNYLHKDFNF